ncbi:unnamed protein product [Fusarium equiseti]|uniref:Uncharacterized protein n=1 Tax=Fusarium equiseti TaxID=61235 RepID=A0A8J2J3V5_FUSEQ|nr:unnamed protein product [Fusarium equiseti]
MAAGSKDELLATGGFGEEEIEGIIGNTRAAAEQRELKALEILEREISLSKRQEQVISALERRNENRDDRSSLTELKELLQEQLSVAPLPESLEQALNINRGGQNTEKESPLKAISDKLQDTHNEIRPTTAKAKALAEFLNQSSPSQAPPASSISFDALTRTTAKTQTTTHTSIPSQESPVGYKEEGKAALATVMQAINEGDEGSAIEPQMPTSMAGCGSYELDQASSVSLGSTIYTPEQRDDAVDRFSQAMLKRLRHNAHYATAKDNSRQHILPRIGEALRVFTETVQVDESVKAHVKGVKIVRRLRREIARQFHDSVLNMGEEDTRRTPLELGDPEQMNYSEKVMNWTSTNDSSDQVPPAGQAGPTDWSDTGTQLAQSSIAMSECEDAAERSIEPETQIHESPRLYGGRIDPAHVMEHLADQPAFEQLITTVEHQLDQYHSDKMQLIRQRTCVALRRHFPNRKGEGALLRAVFNVDWELSDFLTNNYEAGIHQKLDKILAITGSIDCARLCSVGQYFKWCWPRRSSQLLQAIESAIKEANSRTWDSRFRSKFRFARSNAVIVGPTLKTIKVQGTEKFITSIAQQIAWLAAACHEKQDKLTYAYVAFSEAGNSVPTFDISVTLEAVDMESSCSCWNKIVGPAVLINGFSLPERNHNERGLEVSVRVMAAILGIPKAVTFRGGFVFKGRYHALVPVEKLGSSIQWHVVDTYPQRLEWEAIDRFCQTRLREQANIGVFLKGRSFLGWCPKVLESLATEGYNYRSVRYSKASAPSGWVQVDKLVLGFSQWGTVTAEVTLGKKDGYQCQRSDDYDMLLEDARNKQIILYDTTDRRATQTNAEDLILHVLLHQRSLGKPNGDSDRSKKQVEVLQFATPDRRVRTTRAAMINNAEKIFCHRKQFSSSEPKEILFKNEVKSMYATIDGLWAMDYASGKSDFLKMSLQSRSSSVHGWEYMDVVKSASRMSPKSVELQSTCGRWDKYARDIQAVVLFGANFGDILTPASPNSMCPGFTSVPRDQCYLAIRVNTLEHLFTLQGSWEDQRQLTNSGLILSGSHDLFKFCGLQYHIEGKQCCSQRLVRFITLGRKKHAPLPLEMDGAIIIGELKNRILCGLRHLRVDKKQFSLSQLMSRPLMCIAQGSYEAN